MAKSKSSVKNSSKKSNVKKNKPLKKSKKVQKKKINKTATKVISAKPKEEFKKRPLSGSFMTLGLIGLIVVSVYTVSGRIPLTWGFTFIVFFLVMLIASLVSLEPNKKEL